MKKMKWTIRIAVIAAAVLMSLRAAMIYVSETVAVDDCLDMGGSFNYETMTCDFEKSHPYVHAYLLAATNLSQLSPGPPFVGHWVNTSAAYSEYHTFDMTYDPGNDAVSISAVYATHSDTVGLEWFAWSNLLYRANRSDSLVEPSWEPTGSTITGADSIVTIPIQIGHTNQQFLRLRAWPPGGNR